MKINDINIEKYGAKQLTVDMQPAQDQADVEWINGAMLPTTGTSTKTFASLELTLLLHATGQDQLTRNIAELIAALAPGAELTLDGYRDRFVAWYVSSKITKVLRRKDYRKMTLKFKGYLAGNLIRNVYQGTQEAVIRRIGARPTPVQLTITPANTIPEIIVEGLTEDPIVISKLTADTSITIDGRTGMATEHRPGYRNPKSQDVDLWEPPGLHDKIAIIKWSAPAEVVVEYRPIWL